MASPDFSSHGSNVLHSWKEIADHVGRGVRTVQRWERELGMPVRRPRGKSRSAVMAMSDEIDTWLRSAPIGNRTVQQQSETAIRLRTSMERFGLLLDRHEALRAENEKALASLSATLELLAQSLRGRRQEGVPASVQVIVKTLPGVSDNCRNAEVEN